MSAITITFGDRAENHKGNQIIGEERQGFTFEDLSSLEKKVTSKLISLEMKGIKTGILIIPNGIELFVDKDALYQELLALKWDSKALMYGSVRNKKARHNLCFSDFDQEANYTQGKGTIVSFEKLPLLKQIREKLPTILGDKAQNLVAEGNYYYDLRKCGIGLHGDSERNITIGMRLGDPFPLAFQWFLNSEPISERYTFQLNHGDIYIMDSISNGKNWKKRSICTLRHCAGFNY